MRWQALCLQAFALVIAAAGCGGGKSKTTPVKGTVTLDGKPVALASVVFIPRQDGRMVAQAVTNQDGNFELTTYQPNDGALAGEYLVTVTKDETPPADLGDLPADMSPEEVM